MASTSLPISIASNYETFIGICGKGISTFPSKILIPNASV
jgi:hypothetical protein